MPDPHPFGGAHTHVQQHNRALHQNGGARRESNHVPPKSVYLGTPYAHIHENHMPAHSILYDDHRVGKGKAGDGATSTGSSIISRSYRADLKAHMMAGRFYLAMKQDIIDLQNTHGLDFDYYTDGLLAAAWYARQQGLITSDDELREVNNQIASRF